MKVAGLLVGVLVIVQGIVGLVLPDVFLAAVRTMQIPPVLYIAAFIRVVVGLILVLAAAKSRAPLTLRCMGGLILIGGLLTPIFGVELAKVILGWWEQGAGVVRAWAACALALGAFIVYATVPVKNAHAS